jgi:predicted phage terminase large subunit-like protein
MSRLLPLLEYIPALSSGFSAPRHLDPLLSIFERIRRGEAVRAVTSVPPRRGKTESILHAGSWLLLDDPSRQIIYASYAARIAETKSRRARVLAARAGVPIADDSRSRQNWRTGVEEGGWWATGTDGALTGEGGNLLVVDDAHKGRAEAESSVIRERTFQWFKADALTRLEPGGSAIVNGTRWHPDDLLGRLISEGWEHVNLPAITPEGESLWPERWPLAEVLKTQEALGGPDGYEWTNLYMGQPRGRGSRVFGDVVTYDAAPTFERISVGIDYAYSARTSADWSVAVVLGLAAGHYYLIDVVRVQVEPRVFRDRVKLICATHPGARCAAWVAATERGAVEFFRESGIPITDRTAVVDKFSRAIPVAAAWNVGKILVPRKAPWVDGFVSELASFTGVKDRHDDQVDALAAAFDQLRGTNDLHIGSCASERSWDSSPRGWSAGRW